MRLAAALLFIACAAPLRAQDLAGALAAARDDSATDALRGQAWQGAGNHFLNQGDKALAKAAYQLSLGFQPDNPALKQYLASLNEGASPPPARGEEGPQARPELAEGAAAGVGGGGQVVEAVESLFLPGLGQAMNGKASKAWAFALAAAGGWGWWAWSYTDSAAKVKAYDDYAAAQLAIKAAGGQPDPVKADGLYQEAAIATQNNRIASATLLVIHLLAAWDAARDATVPMAGGRAAIEARTDGVQLAWRGRF